MVWVRAKHQIAGLMSIHYSNQKLTDPFATLGEILRPNGTLVVRLDSPFRVAADCIAKGGYSLGRRIVGGSVKCGMAIGGDALVGVGKGGEVIGGVASTNDKTGGRATGGPGIDDNTAGDAHGRLFGPRLLAKRMWQRITAPGQGQLESRIPRFELELRRMIFRHGLGYLSLSASSPEPLWVSRIAEASPLFPGSIRMRRHDLLPQGKFVAERAKDIHEARKNIELGINVNLAGITSKGLFGFFSKYQWLNMWRSTESRFINISEDAENLKPEKGSTFDPPRNTRINSLGSTNIRTASASTLPLSHIVILGAELSRYSKGHLRDMDRPLTIRLIGLNSWHICMICHIGFVTCCDKRSNQTAMNCSGLKGSCSARWKVRCRRLVQPLSLEIALGRTSVMDGAARYISLLALLALLALIVSARKGLLQPSPRCWHISISETGWSPMCRQRQFLSSGNH